MDLLNSNIKGYPGKHIKINTDDPALDFAAVNIFAKQKAIELCADPMLLSWYNDKTGESSPGLLEAENAAA